MGIQNISDVNAMFLSAARDAARKIKHIEQSDQERAMEAFYKAVRSCDKASERMMDKHLESVAESAKKLAEYRKRKAQLDKVLESAERQRFFNESVMIERINHRNMLNEARMEDLKRREVLFAG
ncbi:MAG: hypothetical protein LBQ58_03095 [Synergistaceae bacterium]|jgi:hypothetical protein|nr:hypothetical protein [Synergistaceae bacterium]